MSAMDKVRQVLLDRGSRGIRGLAIIFRKMDDMGDKKLDRNDVKTAFQDYNINVTPAEFDEVFKTFDRDGSGTISFDEFMVGLRGTLNDARRVWVDQAFQKMDSDGDGSIKLDDIKAHYSAKKHPKVISGEKTEDAVLREFLDGFDSRNPDGIVTLDEFRSYYADISASVDTDDYWEAMMKSAWKL